MATNNNRIDIIVEDDSWAQVAVVSEGQCAAVFEAICDFLRHNNIKVRYGLLDVGRPLGAVLVLSNAEQVRQLNAEFRKKDKPTNVLSFANIDAGDFIQTMQSDEVIGLGDIIMAWEVLVDEAKQLKISTEHHFIHLLVHGLLHLLGFDHQNDEEAEIMEGIEIAVLKEMNIDNPYKEFE